MAATAFSQVEQPIQRGTLSAAAQLRGKGRQESPEPESTCKPLIALESL